MRKRNNTCETLLIHHFEANPQTWIKKVDLFNEAYERGGFSPETTCPILRKLEREGKIQKGTYDGKYRKNLTQYLMGEIPKAKQPFIYVNGVPYKV